VAKKGGVRLVFSTGFLNQTDAGIEQFIAGRVCFFTISEKPQVEELSAGGYAKIGWTTTK